VYIYDVTELFLKWGIFFSHGKLYRKSKYAFYVQYFIFENRAVYEIKRKSTVEPEDMTPMTI